LGKLQVIVQLMIMLNKKTKKNIKFSKLNNIYFLIKYVSLLS